MLDTGFTWTQKGYIFEQVRTKDWLSVSVTNMIPL